MVFFFLHEKFLIFFFCMMKMCLDNDLKKT